MTRSTFGVINVAAFHLFHMEIVHVARWFLSLFPSFTSNINIGLSGETYQMWQQKKVITQQQKSSFHYFPVGVAKKIHHRTLFIEWCWKQLISLCSDTEEEV